MTTNETNDSLFGDVIYQYTRAQAIEDGMLIDVTETAREAGITIPTALTAAVWERCVTVPEKASCQDEIRPAVGRADGVAVHDHAEPRRQPGQLHRGSPKRRTTPPAGTTQGPLRTGRLGRTGHHDHDARRGLNRRQRRLPAAAANPNGRRRPPCMAAWRGSRRGACCRCACNRKAWPPLSIRPQPTCPLASSQHHGTSTAGDLSHPHSSHCSFDLHGRTRLAPTASSASPTACVRFDVTHGDGSPVAVLSCLVSSVVFRQMPAPLSPCKPVPGGACHCGLLVGAISRWPLGRVCSSRNGFRVHQLRVNEPQNPFSGGTEDDNERNQAGQHPHPEDFRPQTHGQGSTQEDGLADGDVLRSPIRRSEEGTQPGESSTVGQFQLRPEMLRGAGFRQEGIHDLAGDAREAATPPGRLTTTKRPASERRFPHRLASNYSGLPSTAERGSRLASWMTVSRRYLPDVQTVLCAACRRSTILFVGTQGDWCHAENTRTNLLDWPQ